MLLQTLPEKNRPSWTIKEQLVAGNYISRITEAAVSQPLCLAVQVMLVEILRAAGIQLKAVTGSSSGEIGAAYAAVLEAVMAAEASHEEAMGNCQRPEFTYTYLALSVPHRSLQQCRRRYERCPNIETGTITGLILSNSVNEYLPNDHESLGSRLTHIDSEVEAEANPRRETLGDPGAYQGALQGVNQL
ncbi:uncharacterized protein ATNIH1004_003347 [Aspergillus tanneri]|uniref:Malonyl-CoA:ACP transacylase (MAT) domain-containing protein n=1 Tax=Aspergillus tanneri TaxID=1220188 RepID=A0A5M9N133_9EURO|nr:uncharacterized protein ATNIH1004_003347 [Aspergillus tanneri]KAA8650659.1 hypothetical protein ATNIH1004_003347 [Aspergillus tanneri]